MPRFSHFLGNITINFRMSECLVTCFLRVTVSLLCRLQAVWKIHVPIYPCLIISEGRRNCFTFWSAQQPKRDCQEVTKYKHIQKWMLVFLGKFENRGIKIAWVNSIHISKNINLLLFRMASEVRCDVDISKLTTRAQSINSESLYVLCFVKVLSDQF